MPLELNTGVEANEACQAHELMPNAVVVFEMVLQAPLVLEGAEAEVAIHLVVPRVVDMVLQSVPIFENALAEVAVVLVVERLFDVLKERWLVWKFQRADTTPVLMWIIRLFGTLDS
jgi:hypothetical protein